MFSIVIPLYNKEEHIKTTLNSVLVQKFTDYEIVIVDDGSKDNSLSIASSYTDSRIRVFSIENAGVSNARNYGIEKAEREFIAFLDADDYWEPNYLEQMSVLIKSNPGVGMFASAYKVVYRKKIITIGNDLPEGVVKDYYKEMIRQTITWTSATIVHKPVFSDPEVGNFPIGMVAGQDTFMWAKIATKYKVAFTPKVLASYLYVNSGISLRQTRMDTSEERWSDLLTEGDYYRNEYIAKKGLLVGIRYAMGGFKQESRKVEETYSFTELSKRRYKILFYLNRMPPFGIDLYKKFFNMYTKLKGAV